MKIVKASKIDDIRKARDEWEADYNSKQAKYEEQRSNYKAASEAVKNRLKEKIEKDLSKYDALLFDIYVNHHYDNHLEVVIECGENKMFDDNVALAWSYRVEYKFGGSTFTKETGSWSGLKATTDVQIKWLEQSLDWETLLNPEDIPDYDDYITDPAPSRRSRPDFESQEFNAQLEDLVGKDILVKGTASPNGYIQEGVDGWYKIYRETPKFYKVGFVPDGWINDTNSIIWQGYTSEAIYRIKSYLNSQYNLRKNRVKEFISSPIETMELPDDLK